MKLNRKAALAGLSLVWITGVAAIATAGPEAAAPAAMTAAVYPRLAEKYGEDRTKLAIGLHAEILGLLGDVQATMKLVADMGISPEHVDAGELLGEVAGNLNLTDEQKQKISALGIDAFKRQTGEAARLTGVIRQEREKIVEELLAGDAVARGEMTREDYDAIKPSFDLPKEKLGLAIGGGAQGCGDAALSDKVFTDGVLALLDEAQAKIFREAVEAIAKPAAEEEQKTEFPKLEDMGRELKTGRQVLQGALKVMEGMAADADTAE